MDEHCIGCRSEDCPKHGDAVKRGEHVHCPDIVVEETYWQPIVPGTSRKTFVSAFCGGEHGCGAIFARDGWYVREGGGA